MEEQNNQGQTPTPASPQTNPIPPIPQTAPNSGGLRSKLPWILIVLLLILVGIFGGYFVLNQSKQNQAPSPTPAASQTENSPTPDPIADWLTYSTYHFNTSFKYPSDWKSVDPFPGSPGSSSRIGLIPLNKNQGSSATPIYAEFFYNPNNFSLQKWEEERDKQKLKALNLYSAEAEASTIAGYTAYTNEDYNCEPFLCKRVVIVGQGKIIVFYNLSNDDLYSESELSYNENIFDQILSTIKFFDTTKISCGANSEDGDGSQDCPAGYICSFEGTYPERHGTCLPR